MQKGVTHHLRAQYACSELAGYLNKSSSTRGLAQQAWCHADDTAGELHFECLAAVADAET